jgi:hypothetical protein
MDLYQSKFCLGHKTQKMSGGAWRRPASFWLAKLRLLYAIRGMRRTIAVKHLKLGLL